jgi:hypothetical protein
MDTQTIRDEYESTVVELAPLAEAMLASGASEENVARWAVERRNMLKAKFRRLSPPHIRRRIETRTTALYGNSIGPSADFLAARGKSWQDIIRSACRPGRREDLA